MSKKETNSESAGTVTLSRAVLIFEALGFKTAGGWDVARLQKKLVKLDKLIEGANLDKKTQKRVNAILKAQGAGRTIMVINPEDAAASKVRSKEVGDAAKREETRKEEAKLTRGKKDKKTQENKDKKSKDEAGRSKGKKEKTEKKERKVIEKDKFGSRVGSIQAAINAVLTRKPKTMEQLQKDADVANQQNGHLKNLIEAGFAEKGDKGYSLVSSK